MPGIRRLFYFYPTLPSVVSVFVGWGEAQLGSWCEYIELILTRFSNLSSKSRTCSSSLHFSLALVFFSQEWTGRVMKFIDLMETCDQIHDQNLDRNLEECTWKLCTSHFPHACPFSSSLMSWLVRNILLPVHCLSCVMCWRGLMCCSSRKKEQPVLGFPFKVPLTGYVMLDKSLN